MNLPLLKNADIKGKRVFVRADLDVPLKELGTENPELRMGIADDTRLKAALETIEFLINNEATVIIGGKLGRPRGVDKSLSMEPVAKWIFDQFKVILYEYKMHEAKIGNFNGWELDEKIFVLENLRFYRGEEDNNPSFAKELASLADIYVNDSFAVSHREHASIVGIPKLLPHFAGFHLQKEIEVLGSVLNNPKRPLVVIIGGAKVETKMPLITKMQDLADFVLVGGKLPMEFKGEGGERLFIAQLTEDGTDITEESVDKFKEVISKAATIVWNGPLGLIPNLEQKTENLEQDSEKGTREIAKAVVESLAYKIVGGGDTIDYLKREGLIDKFNFVSMGGGAMLSFLSGEKLPGIEALV